ncbi:SLC13 family permease [Sporomusa malonica]|uniref:Transporter, UIT1 family n=1 Tax=Sporomusa malonica TaxID=112901 RepID=A0A1W1YA26_9FIRM|nr:SLC13 family permease [Sporomusa malonica]SMC32979.1 transporter, UIT1 family [Sporomusa malonica]
MNFALLSVIALILAIVIGVKKKINIGIIAMFFAFSLGHFVFGLKDKDMILKGWPLGIFFIMMSAMFMFSFATVNGATRLLAEKLAYAIRNYAKLLPWAFMLATDLLTGIGADPSVIIFMLPIALIAGEKSGVNPLMLCIMILGGALAGGASPVSVIGIVTAGLTAKAGVEHYLPIWFATITTILSLSFMAYFGLGGLKIKKGEDVEYQKPGDFNAKQIKTLCVIAGALSLILLFKVDIGVAAFIGSGVLLMLGVADEKEAVKSVNWGVLLLVGGTGILVEVMTAVGGIKMMAKFLSSIMTESTAAPIMALIAGLMTYVSSATGVVMPTLFPTLGGIVQELHGTVSPIQLMQGIQAAAIGAVPYSPLSALGAMAMASLPASVDKEKLFTQLIITAALALIWTMFLTYIGVFNIFIR